MQVQNHEQELRLVAENDFKLPNAPALRNIMQKALSGSIATMVVLDMANVQQMDSSGIQLVIGVFKSCEEKNRAFEVARVSPGLFKVFELCKLHTLITIQKEAGSE
jgi:anti-anti-sigma factor